MFFIHFFIIFLLIFILTRDIINPISIFNTIKNKIKKTDLLYNLDHNFLNHDYLIYQDDQKNMKKSLNINLNIPPNPYLSIDSQFENQKHLAGNLITNQKSNISYHDYIKINDICNLGPSNAKNLLQNKIYHKKFWIRISSLRCMAALGIKPTNQQIKTTFKNTDTDLIKRYLERIGNPYYLSSDMFIFKKSIAYLNSKLRLYILKKIYNYNDKDKIKFIVAASYDNDINIRNWANQILKYHLNKNKIEKIKLEISKYYL